MMEVEHSASSGCFGASERRRETSTTGGVEDEEAFLAYMEEFKAEIKSMESTIFNWNGETEKKMETLEKKMETIKADQDQKLDRILQMLTMSQKPADITASAPPAMPGADYGGTQQNLSTAMQTPVPGAGLGSGGSEGGGKLEEKEASRTVSSKAWERPIQSPEPSAGDDGAGLGRDEAAELAEGEQLIHDHVQGMANVSLGVTRKTDSYLKTFTAALSGGVYSNVTAVADKISRTLSMELGLGRDCLNYINESATRAGLKMICDELCKSHYNEDKLDTGDQAVLGKGLRILKKTTKDSTDDEVADYIRRLKLRITKGSSKAYKFGQEFNSCASAAMLALTHALGQTMAHGTVLAMCRGQEPTVLGMDRSLLDTLRRVYDSGSVTEKNVKEELSAVATMQIQVEGGLAACYHELARRLAMLRRNMEILKAFQGVDLEKQSGCQLQTDIVLGMPLQYHTVLTALVPLHVGAVFHRQATKLTDELEEKNKLLNKGATMSITQVQATYVSSIGPDQSVTVSFQDGSMAATAARGLNGRQLVASGPTITATVLQPSATANRAQLQWSMEGGDHDGGVMTDAGTEGGQWAMDDENVSMDELRAMLGSTNAVTSIPYELRPVGEIEGSQSRPGVPGDEGPVDTAVSRRSAVEPINAGWGRRLEDGSMVFPESRISEFCDQWNCMDHGAGLEGHVVFSRDGNIRIIQDLKSPTNG